MRHIPMTFCMLSDWVSFLAYPDLFEIKGFAVVVVVVVDSNAFLCHIILSCRFCKLSGR
jgi:hypothetical protein